MNATSIKDVSIDLPSLHEILQVLTLSAGYNSAIVVLGAALVGMAAGMIGTFSLLRKRSLIGDALAHSALPGLALAYLFAVYIGIPAKNLVVLLSGATISGVLGVLTVQFLIRSTRLSEDTSIGAVLSVFFGLGIVLLSVIQSLQTGSEGGLHHFIYGQTAAMRLGDAYLMLGVAAVAAIASFLLLKEFRLVCFDSDFASAQGWSVYLIDLMMMTLVVAVTVVGLQAVGLILIVALLIIPAASARFWSESLNRVVVISTVLGGISGYFGAAASALLPRLPTGAVIVLTAGFIFLISFLFAPKRGVLASVVRIVRLKFRIRKEHLLRELFEFHESHAGQFLPYLKIHSVRAQSKLSRMILLYSLSSSGLVTQPSPGTIGLSTRGLELASKLTRNHRLWEEFMLVHAELSPTHVDLSADMAEHVLEPELVAELEASLREKGRLPNPGSVLQSVHPLGS